MARPCTVCTHPKGDAIDEALVSGTPIRDIAGQHSLGRSAVDRHRGHIGAALVEAAKRRDEADDAFADDLLAQARSVNRDLLRMLEDAKAPRSLPAFLHVVDRLQKQLALHASLLERAAQAPDGAVIYPWRRGPAQEP